MTRSRQPGRYRIAVFLLAGCMVAVLGYYGLIFDGRLPDHPLVNGWNDLILHYGAYAALTCLVFRSVGTVSPAIVFPTALNAVFEALQMAVPGRTASLVDFLAGFFGTATVLLLILACRRLAARFS